MIHYGTLRDYKFSEGADDIRGAELFGRDQEKLGSISDVIFDHSSGEIRYAVVDTGGWLKSKHFLVPADRLVVHRDLKDNHYQVNLTKAQIEQFPEYPEKLVASERAWHDYERRYRQGSGDAWTEAPAPPAAATQPDGQKVATQPHQGEDLAPHSPQQVAQQAQDAKPETKPASQAYETRTLEGDSIFNNEDLQHLRIEPENANADAAYGGIPIEAVGAESQAATSPSLVTRLGRRWASFQDRLRTYRHELVKHCPTCERERLQDENRQRKDVA